MIKSTAVEAKIELVLVVRYKSPDCKHATHGKMLLFFLVMVPRYTYTLTYYYYYYLLWYLQHSESGEHKPPGCCQYVTCCIGAANCIEPAVTYGKIERVHPHPPGGLVLSVKDNPLIYSVRRSPRAACLAPSLSFSSPPLPLYPLFIVSSSQTSSIHLSVSGFQLVPPVVLFCFYSVLATYLIRSSFRDCLPVSPGIRSALPHDPFASRRSPISSSRHLARIVIYAWLFLVPANLGAPFFCILRAPVGKLTMDLSYRHLDVAPCSYMLFRRWCARLPPGEAPVSITRPEPVHWSRMFILRFVGTGCSKVYLLALVHLPSVL